MEANTAMTCPFCGWEATDGEYLMLLVKTRPHAFPLITPSRTISAFLSDSYV